MRSTLLDALGDEATHSNAGLFLELDAAMPPAMAAKSPRNHSLLTTRMGQDGMGRREGGIRPTAPPDGIGASRAVVTRRRDSQALEHMVHSMDDDWRYGEMGQDGHPAPKPVSASVVAIRQLSQDLTSSSSSAAIAAMPFVTTSASAVSQWRASDAVTSSSCARPATLTSVAAQLRL